MTLIIIDKHSIDKRIFKFGSADPERKLFSIATKNFFYFIYTKDILLRTVFNKKGSENK